MTERKKTTKESSLPKQTDGCRQMNLDCLVFCKKRRGFFIKENKGRGS